MNNKKLSHWLFNFILTALLLAGCGGTTIKPTPIGEDVFEKALLENGLSLWPDDQKYCDSPCVTFLDISHNMAATVYKNGAFNLAWTIGFGVDPNSQPDLAEKILASIYPQDLVTSVIAQVKAPCPTDNSVSVEDTGNYTWNVSCTPSVTVGVYIAPK